MQFILTKEEYESLEEIEYYGNLLESVKSTSAHIVKAICLLESGKPFAYCDRCPIAHLRIKERHSNVSFCRKSKHFSK